MSEKNEFQDFQFPEVPDNRKKLDFQLIETVNPGHKENAANVLKRTGRASCQSESVYDFRKSLAWDSAFFDSPGVLEPDELFETLNIQVLDNGLDINRQKDSESTESARTNRICNLRKSLAWDSAFFTSPGVLDAEELSIINRGYKRPDSIMLPGVEEEIWRSAESNSAVNNDGFSLASLEIDLFDDIKASIHKSRDASIYGGTSICKQERKNGKPNRCASKKSDASSQIRYAASRGESTPSLSRKPPNISGRANPLPIVPSKRPIQVKIDDKAAQSATGKKMSAPKKMCFRESCNMLSSSNLSLKSPSSVLPAARNKYAGFCSASADFSRRSPSNPRRRIDSRMDPSVSSYRTASKYSVRNKTELVSFSDSLSLFSTPKSSPYTSPASSMDACSSEPASTSIKQRSNSSAAGDASKTSDSASHHHTQRCSGHEIWETKFLNPQINDISLFTSPPTNVSRMPRASGLRTPSPKIGYFDVEKSIGLAKNGDLKFDFGLEGTIPKTGSSISSANGSASRIISGKPRLAGRSTGSACKSGVKDEVKMSSREKRQALKEHGYVKAHQHGEDNKENVSSLENHVDYLSQRMGTMNFKNDFSTPVKTNKDPSYFAI